MKGLSEGSEAMHHSGGALSETLLIYGEPISEAFSRLEKPHFFSLGLGLGYVETVIAGFAVKFDRDFLIHTRESENSLVKVFETFLETEKSLDSDSECIRDLHEMLHSVADRLDVSALAVKNRLRRAKSEARWEIAPALVPGNLPEGSFHCLLYDAFSSKTNPELWTEEFLKSFFGKLAASDSLVCTYAYTGALKRTLKELGFQGIERAGFQGKRSATLARRGIFTSPLNS